ncbi:hypothetical protein P691DRAFT_777049 [Macrolepiota fuliginosa MF-IS2]|uniref:Transmembrane protein n=1 Tax=Macrolepiota fuliginosa MF-IS2 TaxID=1400762 RepID=A0A9P5XAR1_9AGAR|nr:hypothetical protein P691DRAFT_777049 [Macrolepiota fuliginosa MF-IS2]
MSQLQLYLDDLSPSVQLTPTTAWSLNSSELWTSGRCQVPNQFPGAKLQFNFNGTTAIFHGASLNDSSFTPIIDDLNQPVVALPSSNPPSYGVWYRTPELEPGPHTVVINNLPNVMLDYIIILVDPATVFQNSMVLVSDSDSTIKYTGSWQQDLSRFKSLQPFTFIGDYSTRSSCNPGDTFSLGFSGSSIQLWGVFDWQSIGSVTAAYFIDGQQIEQTAYQADQTSQNSIYGVQTNYLLFSKSGLTNDPHTIMVKIIACTNQRFSLDYITYSPSFTSGASAPALSGPVDHSSKSHLPVGAIVGIVVGAVALVAVGGFLLRFYKKRRTTGARPFPASSSSSAVTRKEEVPSHMRQLRSPSSTETFPGTTIDGTDRDTANGTWIIAPDPSGVRNINELVSTLPPPAYQNRNPAMNATDNTFETTSRARI